MKLLFQFLSKGKNLVLLFCLFLLFNILLSSFMPKEYALDLKFAYSVEEAYGALSHLDLDQRKLYRFGVWALDMPYMAVYCLLFSGILIKFWKNKKVAWLPVSILVMDFFENLLVLRILKLYPVQNEILAVLASGFTTTKWVLVGILIFVLLIGLFLVVSARKYSPANSAEARI
ncbi:hypothetical protein [Algoriphagus sp. A40]|uniref:hypothetical protein n=1 Tax=Algoriphagus sp. A40 TaxID=1945863 RepID=UPI0009865610|nr:hypothetical protein [Algoriphagus sp. A40]OOG77179.1 hypothetical protein B0E43_06190 [Algoriphagus sp. A40]